jgi:hypothetical protein
MRSTNKIVRNTLAITVIAAATVASVARADNLTVNWNNDSSTLLRNAANVALSGGSPGSNNDGTLIQLGYFSTGTAANNFAGIWTPITGATSLGKTTIGDSADLSGAGNGIFQFNTFFATGTSNVDVYVNGFDSGYYQTHSSISITSSLPPNQQILAIRFFDSNSGTGMYNTVSSDTWKWSSPDNVSIINIDLAASSATLEWESVAAFGLTGTEFKTVLPIPEPSTYALMFIGALGMMVLRRRLRR